MFSNFYFFLKDFSISFKKRIFNFVIIIIIKKLFLGQFLLFKVIFVQFIKNKFLDFNEKQFLEFYFLFFKKLWNGLKSLLELFKI